MSSIKKSIASCICDHDTRLAVSYDGTGSIWKNACTSPADGSLQEDYDLDVITNAVFSGSPDTPQATWNYEDATGGFRGNATAWIKELHRTDLGNQYSMAFNFRTGESLSENYLLFFSDVDTSPDGQKGLYHYIASNGRLVLRHRKTTSLNSLSLSPTYVFLPNTEYFVVFTVDSSTGACQLYVDGALVDDGNGYIDTDTDNRDDGTFGVYAFQHGGGGSALPAGSHRTSFAFFNEILSAEQIILLRGIYKARTVEAERRMSNLNKEAADQSIVRRVYFARLDYESAPLLVTSAPFNISFDWNEDSVDEVFLGVGEYGGMSEIEEGAEIQSYSIQLELNGVPGPALSRALGEHYQNRDCRIWRGFLDEGHRLVDVPDLVFRGRMDTQIIDMQKGSISLNVNSRLMDWERSRIRRYTNEDQQQEYPGDKFFEFVPQMVDKQLRWGD